MPYQRGRQEGPRDAPRLRGGSGRAARHFASNPRATGNASCVHVVYMAADGMQPVFGDLVRVRAAFAAGRRDVDERHAARFAHVRAPRR